MSEITAKEICPICDAELDVKEFFDDEGDTTEEYMRCPQGHYTYTMIFGHVTYHIQDREFGYSTDMEWKEIDKRMRARDRYIKTCRNALIP